MAETVTMPANAQLETFTAGEETPVDVARIERQLAELWQMASESGHDAVSRASLFNLVVLCEDEEARDRATQTISALTSRDPCRAIVLLSRFDRAEAELTASITAHCHLAGAGAKQVCCEQISIHASGEGINRLPGSVLPLLESDLPTVLWWQGNFLQREKLFGRLVKVSDRVFYDTSLWSDCPAQLAGLVRCIEQYPRTRFADLSWTRLTQWRLMTAEIFDEVHCREVLGKVDSIRVVHGPGPGAALRGLLFGAWVAVQLGWSVEDAARRIHIEAGADSDTGSAGLLSVEMVAGEARFGVRKNHGERTASATVHLPSACGLPRKRAFWPTDDAALLSQELDHSARRVVYARALRLASELGGRGPV